MIYSKAGELKVTVKALHNAAKSVQHKTRTGFDQLVITTAASA